MTSQSIHIDRGSKAGIGFTLTVPFPCVYMAVQSNEIKDIDCPLSIELAIPDGTRACESRLVGESGCHKDIYPRIWNNTHFMDIFHQDTSNYQLTFAEAERKLYFKTYQFSISKAWSDVVLPVVNVIILNLRYFQHFNIL